MSRPMSRPNQKEEEEVKKYQILRFNNKTLNNR